jgi:hypothetical protein
MPLKIRTTGLGSGIDKDRPDYTVFTGDWAVGRPRQRAIKRPSQCSVACLSEPWLCFLASSAPTRGGPTGIRPPGRSEHTPRYVS